jgi:formate dehydrogenase major subunit
MGLVKLEIDGKRVIAEGGQTILEAARDNGIDTIPTLCHDRQLEPFSSCYICVVKVQGARTLLPACSTKVAAGMVVETGNTEVRRSRKAALELMLSNHYADCIGPCQIACPAGIDIQGYIALAALGKYHDAIRLIKDRNPLPAICGRVCTRPCEVSGCRRNLLDQAVGIDYIKRYLADLELGRVDAPKPQVPPPNGRRVAVVGAGPAGLSCAYYLALRGFAVQMFEKMPEAGGMLRYGIPEYRLPKEILDLEVNQILDLGVTLSTNVALGEDFTVRSLREEQGFDAVFLGIGAWDSTEMRVQNERTEGVLSGIEFLKNFGLRRAPKLSGHVVVVGGGNTAIDCARTALRVGAEEVTILYRRTRNEMPANEIEIVEAGHEGVAMEFLAAPVKVLQQDGRVSGLECIRMELGEPDASGRRSPKPLRGSEHVVECRFVIAAIGQNTTVAELTAGKVPNFLPPGEMLNLTRWKTIQVNEQTYETSVEGVFSGGDVVTGAATAIEAIAAGRKAAHAIEAYLTGGKAEPEPWEFFSRRDTFGKVTVADLPTRQASSQRPMPLISIEERRNSFTEVETGYALEDVIAESHRCLECGCDALFTCDLRRYATEYGVDISNFVGEALHHEVDRTHPLITLDPNKCILCGRCVRICSDVVGVSAYGFVNRGFATVVRPALGGSLLETDCVSCGLCIGTCPTGAIAAVSHLDKPGPWKSESAPTVCHYCGVGCRLNFEYYGETLLGAARAEDSAVTCGNYCRKGRFGFHWVQDRERLVVPRVRGGREQQPTSLDDALTFTAGRIKDLKRRVSGREIAVFVSPRLSNEEIFLAQKFARVALGTHNVTTFAALANPDLFCPDVVSTGAYRDLLDAQAIVLANSRTDDEHFVADLLAKRAIRQGTKLIYVGADENRTSRLAEAWLPCRPGTEAAVVTALAAAAGGDAGIEPPAAAGLDRAAFDEAARILSKSVLKVLAFNKDFRGPRVAGDDRIFAAAAETMGASLLALREKSNMQGLLDMGAHPCWFPGYRRTDDAAAIEALEKEWCVTLLDLDRECTDVADLLRRKAIKVAVVLGEDPFGTPDLPEELRAGLEAVDLLIAADVVDTATTRAADVVLPLSATAETSGTFTNQERRVQRFRRAVAPRPGMETWQLLCELAARLGLRFKMKYAGVDAVTEEIRRVVPMYREVVVDSPDADGTWDLSRFALPRLPAEPDRADRPAVPAATLALDALEARFGRWFEKTIADARKALTG